MKKIHAQPQYDIYEKFPKTNWHSIIIKQCARIDGTYRFFFRYWEIHLFAPIFFLSIIAFVLTISIIIIKFYFSKTLIIVSLVEINFFLIFSLINYFSAMCMDPGFLPYFWPAIPPSERRFWYKWEQQLTFLATNSEQFNIAAQPPLIDSLNANMDNETQVSSNKCSGETNDQIENSSQIQLDPQRNDGNKYTDDSIIIDVENVNNASAAQSINNQDNHNHSKLRFASFSKSSGRFVIRADHICGWISNWVGKRNHKQFILFTFYGGLFAASLLIWRVLAFFISQDSSKKKSKALNICDIISIVIESLLSIILIPFCINQLYQLSQGKTQIQRMKNTDRTNSQSKTNCVTEMRQVFGEANFFCWLCPTPAFDKDLYIEGYS